MVREARFSLDDARHAGFSPNNADSADDDDESWRDFDPLDHRPKKPRRHRQTPKLSPTERPPRTGRASD